MSSETNDLALILSYLAAETSAQQNREVERRMAEEERFANLMAEVKLMQHGIILKERKNIIDQMDAWEEALAFPEKDLLTAGLKNKKRKELIEKFGQWEKKPAIKGRTILLDRRTWSIAAVILFLLSLGLYFLLPAKVDPKQDFIQTAITEDPYPVDLFRRSGTNRNEIEKWTEEAKNYYRNGQYGKAIPLLEKIVALDPESKVQLYLGIALLADKEPAAALPPLTYMRNNYPIYRDVTSWYLALTYLALDRQEELEAVLSQLENRPDYQEKVASLRAFMEEETSNDKDPSED